MIILHDKDQIERHLRTDPALHLYELGDLDDFFWPQTLWFGLNDGGQTRALALLYAGAGLPVLIALSRQGGVHLEQLLAELRSLLPRQFYCHLSPGLDRGLRPQYRLEHHGRHLKMTLVDQERLQRINTAESLPLSSRDLTELLGFYRDCYPGNWFDPRMLETGQYFGIRRDGRLASVAGIHVYSPRYRVAALGNIATDPALRGRGLGAAATAALCKNLLVTVDTIGLNVKADNAGAIRCYEKLGFVATGEYDEYTATAAPG